MDWCAAVVRRLVEFTQAGGEVVIVVAGINVGAQSYWNAEATMLMHCAGMLVMVEGTAMVLTGHRALAQAGGVSERSDHDLGGTAVMLPNGQAHHRADRPGRGAAARARPTTACVPTAPTIRSRRAPRRSTADRDVCDDPYDGPEHGQRPAHRGVTDLGDVLSAATNPQRTRPFAIEPGDVRAWPTAMLPSCGDGRRCTGASGAHVWDTRVDGWPVSLIGIDARPRAWSRTVGRPPARSTRWRPARSPGRSTTPAVDVRRWCWRTSPASTAPASRCWTDSSNTAPNSPGRWSTSGGRWWWWSSAGSTAGPTWC